jgi:FixJ family two-component response regulator
MSRGTVFIVDDDPAFLRALSRSLRAGGYQVEAFESAQAFLARLSPDLTGCVVADLRMPGLNGLELQTALSKTENPLPVVFLTGEGDIPTTVQAMRSGAEDFLTKTAPREQLLGAIERAFTREAGQRQHREHLALLQRRFATLTTRELEVLRLVVRGLLNKQIAGELDINERTVKLHRTNLTRRLGVQSVAELTRMVGEAQLFQNVP